MTDTADSSQPDGSPGPAKADEAVESRAPIDAVNSSEPEALAESSTPTDVKESANTKEPDVAAVPVDIGASAVAVEPKVSPGQEEHFESSIQPLWHVLVLTMMTMFAYSIIWIFKTWKELADYANERHQASETDSEPLSHFRKVSPVLRTLGSVVPWLQIYMLTVLFVRVAQLHPNKNSPVSRYPIPAGILLTASGFGLMHLASLPEPFRMLYLLSAIPFVVAQAWINAYWRTQEPPGLVVRQAFTAGELGLLIFGSILLGLNVIHIFLHWF